MTDWKALLREADPLGDPGAAMPPESEIRRIRQAVLLAATSPRWPATRLWPRPPAVAVVVLLMVTAGTVGGLRLRDLEHATRPPVTHRIPETRQLQFATPGGTRIIWVFNSEFTIHETMP